MLSKSLRLSVHHPPVTSSFAVHWLLIWRTYRSSKGLVVNFICEFFLSHTWQVVFETHGLAWDPRNIRLFDPKVRSPLTGKYAVLYSSSRSFDMWFFLAYLSLQGAGMNLIRKFFVSYYGMLCTNALKLKYLFTAEVITKCLISLAFKRRTPSSAHIDVAL